MAAAMTGRHLSSGGDYEADQFNWEAKSVVKRARMIYNEAIDQLWPGEKALKAPTGGETTPPFKGDIADEVTKRGNFKGPRVGMGWSDENLPEESGYHK
jgi:hypothetical protein